MIGPYFCYFKLKLFRVLAICEETFRSQSITISRQERTLVDRSRAVEQTSEGKPTLRKVTSTYAGEHLGVYLLGMLSLYADDLSQIMTTCIALP